ncbi:MAG: hypothetical protein HYV68_02475 [Candidatus Taylorbacteria bacterium]|nr:hypothetical protein [Candidatus Taylorbacteria bacterium]
MKIQVLSIGSVWFGKEVIAICPWGNNPKNTYYTLADIRKVARDAGFPRLAGTRETELFGKEMVRDEQKRKDAPISWLLSFRHRSKIRRSPSRTGNAGRSRSELIQVPALCVNPHPSSTGTGLPKVETEPLCWGAQQVEKVSGEIYISPYQYVVFSK